MTRRALFLLCLIAPRAEAQVTPPVGGRSEIFAGSELEHYLRLLQIDGPVRLYPWSIAPFGAAEIDRLLPPDTLHPWVRRYALEPSVRRGPWFDLVRPTLASIVNTTFPYGSNDGPIWAGRGLTTALQVGLAARYGPLSLTLAPLAFRAENSTFALLPNGETGSLAFGDGQWPTYIDRPQRFGNAPYTVLDPGQSTLRADLPGVAVGVSTANQRWGPATDHPLILGNNAAGFPHLFVGTSQPASLWIARLHVRFVWGTLAQSAYSSMSGRESRRFMSGFVAVATPRGLPGLELGGARFFHTPWPAGGLTASNFAKPLETFLKTNLPDNPEFPNDPNQDADNQLASVFFRWVLPSGGFELYGEYGREDHSWDLRDLVLEPDHSAGYMLGFRKVWRRAQRGFLALRGEIVNFEPSGLIRGGGGRDEGPFYLHFRARQGHTQRGQVLGADVGNGGAASSLVLDYYHPRGRWSAGWSRDLRQDTGEYWRTGVVNQRGLDVVHALWLEGLLFRGRLDVTGRVTAAYEFNRNFAGDAFNLNLVLRVRADLPGRRLRSTVTRRTAVARGGR